MMEYRKAEKGVILREVRGDWQGKTLVFSSRRGIGTE